MPAPYTGKCFCGSAQYRIAEEPLARPQAHLWTRSAQPWVAIPEGVPRYETQPKDFNELLEIGRRP